MSRTIEELPEVVVNKLAAGEILQRPANAVKELIENRYKNEVKFRFFRWFSHKFSYLHFPAWTLEPRKSQSQLRTEA